MGLALGLNPQELGVNKHFVDTSAVVKKVVEGKGRRETA